MKHWRKVSFGHIRRILREENRAMFGWEIAQYFPKNNKNLCLVHACLKKLFMAGDVSRKKAWAQKVTGRHENAFCYTLIVD